MNKAMLILEFVRWAFSEKAHGTLLQYFIDTSVQSVGIDATLAAFESAVSAIKEEKEIEDQLKGDS